MKRGSKAANTYWHARNRCAERYGDLSAEDIQDIRRRCRWACKHQGEGNGALMRRGVVLVDFSRSNRPWMRVEHHGRHYLLVFDRAASRIVTFLPEGARRHAPEAPSLGEQQRALTTRRSAIEGTDRAERAASR